MDKITVKNLPEQKLSQVILKVIEDLDRVQKFGYKIDMSNWIETSTNDNDTCIVCLGGAAVMGFVPDERVKVNYAELEELIVSGVNEGISTKEEYMLKDLAYMFNELRTGNMVPTVEFWNKIAVEPIDDLGHKISRKVKQDISEFTDEFGGTSYSGRIGKEQLKDLKHYLAAVSKSFEELGH